MKHLLHGVAVAAALVIAAPVWAQSPSGGNPMGTPGPNPGGPGLTPYSGGAPGPGACGEFSDAAGAPRAGHAPFPPSYGAQGGADRRHHRPA